MADQAFVTLTTNDSYAKGALVLGSSLKQHRTTRRLAVLTTPQVSDSMRKVLETVFDEVILVDVLDSGDSAHLTLLERPELGVTLTKLHCWSLTQYSKCVFMDADTLVLANIDDLFEREELSAAPDPGWPDCFNSGVFVYRPSVETYGQLLRVAAEQGSFDGGDQGLLNMFFSSWATTDIRKHLPFIYNLSSISIYSYLPAFKAFGANAKVVHFLGRIKPWSYTYNPETKSVQSEPQDPTMVHPEFLSLWWDIFTTSVFPLLQQFGLATDPHSHLTVEDVSGAMSHLALGETPAPAQPSVSSEERKERWEQGQADYMGADSFDNIKRKLDTYLQ
ncbi:glycogenin-1 isoform 1-T1 [Molossus nigricans]|uniref:glycogenin glucosyltransferase n=3 Tax=Molossus molossus TaxID=27622 RepID=A0A7J8I045_MOLMO|nr:glycogenin-1 isoform X1 [Molossus molossus]KAF6477631.1 glycogenin 1 [Molossus molossus]